jgi:hypothetical protein
MSILIKATRPELRREPQSRGFLLVYQPAKCTFIEHAPLIMHQSHFSSQLFRSRDAKPVAAELRLARHTVKLAVLLIP